MLGERSERSSGGTRSSGLEGGPGGRTADVADLVAGIVLIVDDRAMKRKQSEGRRNAGNDK